MTMTTRPTATTDQHDDLRELRRLFEGLLSSRGIRMDASGVAMWLDAFADLSPSEVSIAIRRFNRETDPKIFPSPSAVRQYAGVRGLGDANRSALAWAAVRKAVRCHGAVASVDFDDRIINAVIHDLGGWVVFIESLDDRTTLPFREKDFRERYHAISLSGVGDGSRLIGRIETENRAKGFTPQRLQQEARKRFGDQIPAAVQRRIALLSQSMASVTIRTGLSPHPIAKRLHCSASMQAVGSSPAALIGELPSNVT